jgi:hypothetical protein
MQAVLPLIGLIQRGFASGHSEKDGLGGIGNNEALRVELATKAVIFTRERYSRSAGQRLKTRPFNRRRSGHAG